MWTFNCFHEDNVEDIVLEFHNSDDSGVDDDLILLIVLSSLLYIFMYMGITG